MSLIIWQQNISGFYRLILFSLLSSWYWYKNNSLCCLVSFSLLSIFYCYKDNSLCCLVLFSLLSIWYCYKNNSLCCLVWFYLLSIWYWNLYEKVFMLLYMIFRCVSISRTRCVNQEPLLQKIANIEIFLNNSKFPEFLCKCMLVFRMISTIEWYAQIDMHIKMLCTYE